MEMKTPVSEDLTQAGTSNMAPSILFTLCQQPGGLGWGEPG